MVFLIIYKFVILTYMADASKGKDGGSSGNGLTHFLAILIILFIVWIITGGPERNTSSRTNQFIEPDGSTYHDDVFGKPGSVTNKLPFFK
jgi:hypothetical protein